jgi:hypothetical protein
MAALTGAPTMQLDDERALKLGRELAELLNPWEIPSNAILISLGRIAFKRSMELMREVQ